MRKLFRDMSIMSRRNLAIVLIALPLTIFKAPQSWHPLALVFFPFYWFGVWFMLVLMGQLIEAVVRSCHLEPTAEYPFEKGHTPSMYVPLIFAISVAVVLLGPMLIHLLNVL